MIAAIAVAVSVGRRELRRTDPPAPPELAFSGLPTFVPEWKDVRKDGIALGPAEGPVQVLIFSDLECPYCARFHQQVLPSLHKKYPGKVNVTFVHLPIKSHRFAVQAATALECATDQGRSSEFLDAVYRNQDSIGIRRWANFSVDAHVPDVARLEECMKSPPPDRIEAGRRWATRLQVGFTPTILINGWRFAQVPSDSAVVSVVDAVLAGKSPGDCRTSEPLSTVCNFP